MKTLTQPKTNQRSTTRELLELRARRLLKLLKLDAPDIVLAAEIGLLANTVGRSTSRCRA